MPARDIAGDIWLCFLFIHCHSHRLFCVTILSYVLGSGRVTSDKIFAAICVYMLLGYGWTFVYSILLELQPQSVVATSEVARNDYVGRILQLRDFRFMTLSTVCYGGSVPQS